MTKTFSSAIALLGSGCVAIPFATPPTRVTTTVGAALGSPTRDSGGETEDTAATMTTRFGIFPAAAVRQARDRELDIGAGWGVEVFDGRGPDDVRHLLFVEVLGHAVTSRIDDYFTLRFAIEASPELVLVERQDGLAVGAGGTIGASLELAGFVQGAAAGANAAGFGAGAGLGEVSFGLVARAGFRAVADHEYAVLEIGAVLRIPLSGGVYFAILCPR